MSCIVLSPKNAQQSEFALFTSKQDLKEGTAPQTKIEHLPNNVQLQFALFIYLNRT